MAARSGLTAWMVEKLRAGRRAPPRLALVERIALAPRQSLALVEAEGRRFLVATSPEGAPAFYPLDELARGAGRGRSAAMPRGYVGTAARVSW
jgi:flagellar biogenesis protein FliO